MTVMTVGATSRIGGESIMKVSSLKATAFFTAAAFAASVGVAHAVPLTAADAKCRSTIAKNSGKVMSTLSKAYDKCIKTALKSGSGTCNNTATADPGGKAAKAKPKSNGKAKKKRAKRSHEDSEEEDEVLDDSDESDFESKPKRPKRSSPRRKRKDEKGSIGFFFWKGKC